MEHPPSLMLSQNVSLCCIHLSLRMMQVFHSVSLWCIVACVTTLLCQRIRKPRRQLREPEAYSVDMLNKRMTHILCQPWQGSIELHYTPQNGAHLGTYGFFSWNFPRNVFKPWLATVTGTVGEGNLLWNTWQKQYRGRGGVELRRRMWERRETQLRQGINHKS